jgi:thioredoxin 1
MAVQHVKTMEEFQALLNASNKDSKLLVVDFTASWCGPCRFIGPIVEEMAKDNENIDVSFAKVDVDEASDVSSACGIQVLPTFQFYKKSSKIEEMKGANEKKLRGLVLYKSFENPVSPLLESPNSKPSSMFALVVMWIKHESSSKSIPALCRNPPHRIGTTTISCVAGGSL